MDFLQPAFIVVCVLGGIVIIAMAMWASTK